MSNLGSPKIFKSFDFALKFLDFAAEVYFEKFQCMEELLKVFFLKFKQTARSEARYLPPYRMKKVKFMSFVHFRAPFVENEVPLLFSLEFEDSAVGVSGVGCF